MPPALPLRSSTFAEYTVLAEISCAKVNPALDPKKSCLFGCGIATGLGAVWNTAKVEYNSSVAVFGLGAVGFAVVQAAKAAGAGTIVGIDVNPKKFELAKKLGCSYCLNPADHEGTPMQQACARTALCTHAHSALMCKLCSAKHIPVQSTFRCKRGRASMAVQAFPCKHARTLSERSPHLTPLLPLLSPPLPLQVLVGMSPTKFGFDYTFDCTGNVAVMRSALEAAHRGWGHCTLIGVAASGKEISTRPFQFITGRKCTGTAFGGWKTRDAVPMLVNRALNGEIALDHYITHNFKGVSGTTKALEALHSGDCLRAVVEY